MRDLGLVAIKLVSSRQLVAAAAADGTASLYTLDGKHVGTFGQPSAWDVADVGSYAARAPMVRDRERA